MNSNRAFRIIGLASGLGLVSAVAVGCMASEEPAADDQEATQESAVGPAICLGSQSGAYCGGDMMSNANAATLYQCAGANKPAISAIACTTGCVIAPAGKADACAPGATCLGSGAGAYCGGDGMKNADPTRLYQCPGLGLAPTSSIACASGCVIAPPGTPDLCAAPVSDAGPGSEGSYRLPWRPGVAMWLAQDCNDACCNDHVGTAGFAWDFADATNFDILAARGGTVTQVKIDSTVGCASFACASDANFIVIDHGDGTESLYLHLEGSTLDPAVTCGGHVDQGQKLASAGSTGWSSGTHLHFQVNAVNASAPECACGPTGHACSSGYVPWQDFWSSVTYPTLPVSFEEWPAASACHNRRITLPASQN